MAPQDHRYTQIPGNGGAPGPSPRPLPARAAGPVSRAWPFLLIVALTAIAYSNTLHGPFLFDDYENIVLNGYIRIKDLSLQGLAAAAFKSPLPTRPVANVSFALNHLVHGYSLPGYHLTNIAIHILNGVFLFLLTNATLSMPAVCPGSSRRTRRNAALAAALLWTVNPMDTQSVSYIVQRMNSMAAMFHILALLLYTKGRQANGGRRLAAFAGAAASGLLALGSKEISATLPITVFLYEWFFFQDLDPAWLKKKLPLAAAAAAACIVIAGVYLKWDFLGFLHGYAGRKFTLGQRLLTEPRVIWRYLWLFFLPWPGFLNLDYSYPLSTGLFRPPGTAAAIAGLFVLLAGSIAIARRHRLPAFAALWFLINLAIESSFIPLEIIFEHRCYLPSMFIWPALASLVLAMPARGKTVAAGLAVALIALHASWTYQRNHIWADEIRLNRDIVSKNPRDARAVTNLGRALLYNGHEDEALRELEKAMRLDPLYPFAYLNRGGYYLKKGLYDKAAEDFRTTIRLMPTYDKAWFFLSKALFLAGRYPETVAAARQASMIPAYRQQALLYLGIASSKTGDLESAIDSFRELTRRWPRNGRYHFNLGRALEKAGQDRAALEEYRKALSLTASQPDRRVMAAAAARLQRHIIHNPPPKLRTRR